MNSILETSHSNSIEDYIPENSSPEATTDNIQEIIEIIEIPDGSINVSGIDKAELLAELINNSKPIGSGFLQFDNKIITRNYAVKRLEKFNYFDYEKGCPIKTNFENWPIISTIGYDRDNGEGAFKRCVDNLKNGTYNKREAIPDKEIIQERARITTYWEAQNACYATQQEKSRYSGKTISSCNLSLFDKVWFVPNYCQELKRQGISYSSDFHIFMRSDGTIASFRDSMEGTFFSVNTDLAVVERHE